jgi:8-oxo-dGTP pyrophosphatase MutT (NUDIX family)
VPTRLALGGNRVLTLPKGHLEPGEQPEDAAIREVREEAGVEARLVDRLNDLRYWYQRDGMRITKVVSFFLLEYVGGDPSQHDLDEVEDARWMPLDEAESSLTYRGERGIVALAKVHPACRF